MFEDEKSFQQRYKPLKEISKVLLFRMVYNISLVNHKLIDLLRRQSQVSLNLWFTFFEQHQEIAFRSEEPDNECSVLLQSTIKCSKVSEVTFQRMTNTQLPKNLQPCLAGWCCQIQGAWTKLEAVSFFKLTLKVLMIYVYFMEIWALV